MDAARVMMGAHNDESEKRKKRMQIHIHSVCGPLLQRFSCGCMRLCSMHDHMITYLGFLVDQRVGQVSVRLNVCYNRARQ